MNKPNNFDNTRANTNYTPIILGGHRCIIQSVEEKQSRSGRDMISVYIDFASEDAQPKYFAEQYRSDTRAEKKWPFQAIQNILVNDSEGNTSRSFKSFCTAFEDSNGVQIKWGCSDWEKQFKGRRIGAVFGEVEEEYNGEIKTRRRIRWFCDDHKAGDANIPAKKFATSSSSSPADSGNEWMPVNFEGDELPFR